MIPKTDMMIETKQDVLALGMQDFDSELDDCDDESLFPNKLDERSLVRSMGNQSRTVALTRRDGSRPRTNDEKS